MPPVPELRCGDSRRALQLREQDGVRCAPRRGAGLQHPLRPSGTPPSLGLVGHLPPSLLSRDKQDTTEVAKEQLR